MTFRHSTEELEEIGDPRRTMSYHRGGQAGAVAVSYSTSPMAPLSPSRRYSSGTGSSSSTTSGIGSSTSKFNTYRTGTASLLDRPTSFYTSSSGSSLRSEYRRSYCTSGRSVSSSSYGETGGSGGGAALTTIVNGTSGGSSRYASPSSSASISSSSSTRERSNVDTIADFINKHSPAGYVPNIQRQQPLISGSTHHWKNRSTSSSLNELFGGDEREVVERRTLRPESSLSSSSSSSSAAVVGGAAGLWSRSSKRRSPAGSTVLITTGHARADSAASFTEVTSTTDDHISHKLKDDDNDDNDDDTKDVNSDDDQHNNNGNIGNGGDIACGYGVNNNDVRDDDNDDGDEDKNDDVDVDVNVDVDNDDNDDDDDDNLNHHHHRFLQQRSYQPNEVSPAKHNLLSAAAAAGGGSLIGLSSLDLLTNLATNPRNNTALLINNNAQDKVTGGVEEVEGIRIATSNEVTRGADDILSSDATAFLQGGRASGPSISENGEDERNVSGVSDDTDFSGSPPIDSIAGRPSVTHGDDHPSIPSTSRRADQPGLFSAATSSNLTSSPTNLSTAHQSIYRGVNEQYLRTSSRHRHFEVVYKLAHTQVIEWALWCLWTVIALVSIYAFFLGIAAPLTASPKRISSKINSIRIGNSAITLSVVPRAVRSSIAYSQEGSPTNRSARNRLQAYRDERCGLNGLRNIGNTCFMNSVIQCLSNTRPLLEYLLNEQYLADINTTTSSMKGALIKAFSQVIHELWEVGGDHVVNTTALKSQIQRFAPRFMGYSQQDAQEFLRYLLEGLHEDVNRVTTKLPPIHGDIPDTYTDMQKAVESWKRYLRSEDSMVVDVFVGQLRSSLHCTSCDHVSVTLDPFWDLSLPIPARSGTVKLSQCLEHFTREEVLDGDEKPTCSKCQMRRKCTKSFSIQKFPKILVIHLKRFSPMERFRGKLNVMVDFPLTGLDLSAFAAPRVPGCTYNLYGVANHSGTTYSGHYTAYCKHPYSGEWHEYNDSRVSVVSARSVVSSEAYVLFYEQQPHSSHL